MACEKYPNAPTCLCAEECARQTETHPLTEFDRCVTDSDGSESFRLRIGLNRWVSCICPIGSEVTMFFAQYGHALIYETDATPKMIAAVEQTEKMEPRIFMEGDVAEFNGIKNQVQDCIKRGTIPPEKAIEKMARVCVDFTGSLQRACRIPIRRSLGERDHDLLPLPNVLKKALTDYILP